jgi:riboflavin kinase/FMN adenylyltransferase
MKVINDLNEINQELQNTYIALGNFDGVHKGHQMLINKCKDLALKNNCKSVVITFHPHPQLILNKNIKGLITTKSIKEKLIEKMGIDYLVFLPFSKEFSNISPQEFFYNIILKFFKPKCIIVGFNYTFGKSGRGNIDNLKEIGSKEEFDVEIIPPYYLNGKLVSSSLIRNYLNDGNIKLVYYYLGYYPSIIGKVGHGEKIATKLGYPTLNLIPEKHTLFPSNGVYATITENNNKKLFSITNIGFKPTFGIHEKTIETHILNFECDIYNKNVTIQFVEKIRDEKKFNTSNELINQIKSDIQNVENIFELSNCGKY